MLRGIILFCLTALLAVANIRLYLKDGEYQLVREYKVQTDRVRYYSVERGAWEEIPLDLVDLKKTESEAKLREESIKEETQALAAEEKAERDANREIAKVPQEQGVYLVDGQSLKTIPAAESKFVGDTKKRSILKVITPIPIIAGKGTLEIDGPHSSNVIDKEVPEFYIRLAAEERFGIIRLTDHKGNRVVEELTIVPVTKEVIEEQKEVQVFRRQVGDMLYKIWPMKPLEPGEYAVVEYSPAIDDGNIHVQVWDFAFKPGAVTADPPKR